MKEYIIGALIGYLFGCSSMAYYLSKLRGFDLREKNTGNLGASNAMITMGWGAGVLTAVHDVLKGLLAILLVRALFPGVPYLDLVTGVGAVLGHNFPVFLSFRGGKGLATFFGMIFAVSWKFGLVMLVIAAALTLITDYVVVATTASALIFPVYLAYAFNWTAFAIVAVSSVAIISKHGANYRRILDGTEVGLRSGARGDHRIK